MIARGAYQGSGRGTPISPRQIKIIHTLKNALGMDDDTYRLALSAAGAKGDRPSSKGLTWRQAEALIQDLQQKTGTPSPSQPRPKPFADLDGRPGMATGAQCRLIAAMWGEVTRAETAEQKKKALNSFISRIAGVSDIRFLKSEDVEKMVKAIKTMKSVKEEADAKARDGA